MIVSAEAQEIAKRLAGLPTAQVFAWFAKTYGVSGLVYLLNESSFNKTHRETFEMAADELNEMGLTEVAAALYKFAAGQPSEFSDHFITYTDPTDIRAIHLRNKRCRADYIAGRKQRGLPVIDDPKLDQQLDRIQTFDEMMGIQGIALNRAS